MSRVNVGWSGTAAAPRCWETAYAVALTAAIDSKRFMTTTIVPRFTIAGSTEGAGELSNS